MNFNSPSHTEKLRIGKLLRLQFFNSQFAKSDAKVVFFDELGK